MAIDPMLYERVSGRKGDPHSRMGAALAGSDAAQARRTTEKARSYTEASLIMRYKMWGIGTVAVLIVAAIVRVAMKVFG